jgi:hypothetical protein
MKLYEILALNEVPTKSLLFDEMQPYLKSLYVYYKDMFCCEPVLMVTDLFNAAQYVKIVPSNDFNEAICEYLEDYACNNEENENYAYFETINFNSRLLKDII